jgi:acyl carrier protein
MQATKANIQGWCQTYIANLLDVPADKVDADTEFDRFGLDSAMAVAMCLDLEEELGIEIPPALLFEYTTIAQLASYVAMNAQRTHGDAA